jgi:hypothetical protein
MMKWIYIFCLSTVLTYANIHPANEIEEVISRVSIEERNTLELFAQSILNSEASYVLFGNKPMCTVGFFSSDYQVFSESIESYVVDFLKDLKLNPKDKKYPFVFSGQNILFINRDRFMTVVNENISLFRFFFGRTLTAEKFLETILDSEDCFRDILKYNKLIIGMLLGYGTQNSLLVSREEDLSCELADDRTFYPFKDYETFIRFQRSPSLGFSSIEEESKALSHSCQISRHLLPFKDFPIPYFGCEPKSKETGNLLSIYGKDREHILEVMQDGEALSKLLNRLCLSIDNAIVTPMSLKWSPSFDLKDNKKIVDCLVLEILDHCKPYLDAVLKGIASKEKNEFRSLYRWLENWPYKDEFQAVYDPEYLYNRCLINERATKTLSNMAKQKKLVALIPGYIYHEVLLRGKGFPATNKIKWATFQFSLFAENGSIVEAKTLQKVALTDLSPGIAHSIVGMRKGEEREISMHPNYTAGANNASLLCKTHLRLLDFEEGEKDVQFAPVQSDIVSLENMDQFKLEYKKIMEDRYFGKGYYLWEAIQEQGIPITAAEFSKRLKANDRTHSFSNEEEIKLFISNYNKYLFSQKIKRSTLDLTSLFDY